METQILYNNNEDIKTASEILKAGGIVAIPTETVYGLAANALNETAVKKIYEVKKRESKKALLVLIPNINYIYNLTTDFNNIARKLAKSFWPGALTIVLNKSAKVPDITTAGGKTIAVRLTSKYIIRRLIQESGLILTAPSANISGEPNLLTSQAVLDKFSGKIDAILCDDIVSTNNKVSTLINTVNGKAEILREGAISKEKINSELIRKQPIIIGITGPTGAGKSTILKSINLNDEYTIIDADKIAREVVNKGEPCLNELIQAFSQDILEKDGTLNRKKLAKKAFSNSDNINLLNSITHPFIIDKIRNNINKININTVKSVLIDAPTLFQSGLDAMCDKIISINASDDDRLNRIMDRDNINREEAQLRMNAGLSVEYYKKYSDFVIETSNKSKNVSILELQEYIK